MADAISRQGTQVGRQQGRRPRPSKVLGLILSQNLSLSLCLILCASLGMTLSLSLTSAAHAAPRSKSSASVLALFYGKPIRRAEAEAAIGGDHLGHPLALRQAVLAVLDLRLALRGLRPGAVRTLTAQAETLAAEMEAHQGGASTWTAQLASLGQTPTAWQRAALTRLAVAAQLPGDATAVTEAAIVDRYQRRWGRFVAPAQVLLSEIAVPLASDATPEVDRARAVLIAAHERLERGEPFAQVAKTLSQTPDAWRGGDRGWVGADVLDVALRNALDALQPGQRTRPVQSAWGLHILWLRERQLARKLSLAEARPLVVAQLAAERGQVARRQWLDSARAKAEKAGQLRWMVPK